MDASSRPATLPHETATAPAYAPPQALHALPFP